MIRQKKSISLLICGEAGQGIQTIEAMLARIIKDCGFNVYATKEYMSRVRGGSNSVELRMGREIIRAPIKIVDICVLLSKDAFSHVESRLSGSTIIIGDKSVLGDSCEGVVDIPLRQEAETIGGRIYANIIAVGIISGMIGLSEEKALERAEKVFANKGKDIVKNNKRAVSRGYILASNLIDSGQIPKEKIVLPEGPCAPKKEILCNGADGIAIGAIGGGCNFISSYPMSPSTAVLTFLSQRASEFNIIAEQAEDEISAINMALGAWYAGARAMVTTSGGGFALMEEGVSLAGMLEMPVVIHMAQRPGPATGLPTRTEQGDLEMVLYSGHGEFPRVIFAPGSISEAFSCSRRAFYIADKYQVPVFILTDQYLIDSYYNCDPFPVRGDDSKNHIIRTGKDYKRYRLTEDGISPRGIPGYGDGLVLVDSDEHDEEGRITEDMKIRELMVDKRLKKAHLIAGDALAPVLIGNPGYSTLVISWGSTFHIVEESLKRLGRSDIAQLHFSQVHPLHEDTKKYLKKAKKTIIVENNATSQFGRLIKLNTSVEPEIKILKYDGLPFFADELAERLEKVI